MSELYCYDCGFYCIDEYLELKCEKCNNKIIYLCWYCVEYFDDKLNTECPTCNQEYKITEKFNDRNNINI